MIEIKVPSPGESVLTVILATWLVSDGEYVEKDREVAEIDSDKATLSIAAPESGVIKFLKQAGEQASVGEIIATIAPAEGRQLPGKPEATPEKSAESGQKLVEKSQQEQQLSETKGKPQLQETEKQHQLNISPLARAKMVSENLTEDDLLQMLQGRRIKQKDIDKLVSSAGDGVKNVEALSEGGSREVERLKMSPLRIKLSDRLVKVKNETAMLTTFNEVDMTEIMKLRSTYSKKFEEKHGTRLGLMSFFAKAATAALEFFPAVNAYIDGDEVVYHKYVDLSIAVSAPKGLVVPVVRNANTLSLVELELEIKRIAEKARTNKLTLDEMLGGTFTLTNGGVFGSMLSTPIINPPQSAILGMHNIVERPVAVDGKVEIRPVMYIALSYDHRIIDGRESVGFLVKVKEFVENPLHLLMPANPESELLGL